MRRVEITPRPDWRAKMEALGFDFHTIPSPEDPSGIYWDESAYWLLSEAEVDLLDDASVELHRMCLAAARRIVSERLYPLLNIPPDVVPAIEASWKRHEAGEEFSLYGRFDLAFGGPGHGDGMPKLLEYNADTPTGLYEAAVAQWAWLEDVFPEGDQFNSIHEGLVERWQELLRRDRTLAEDPARRAAGAAGQLHLTCAMPHKEDEGTLRYIQDTATEAGLATKSIALGDIGWTEEEFGSQPRGWFSDLEEVEITTLFKLTPWEWLVEDEFGGHLLRLSQTGAVRTIEPAWKILLSNKGLLAVLWEMYPHHPYLVEAHFDRRAFAPGTRVVAKPLLGREGANISVATLGEGGVVQGRPELETAGPYGEEGYVYQAWSPVANATDSTGRTLHAVVGAWMVGDACRGIGIREDISAITHNTSRFVPHRFE
ncbi:glutathionylspermidine synthase family protein [Indioceanicola profundi]|uniref:glutathionylspermidine synthase family protein n=1 Tax=Indioceanicola profundi TaxID=2220096 RepID=UPI000E6AAD3C|nr:glutathionylspermidine synthase family protein [Indioceanicola profundi]